MSSSDKFVQDSDNYNKIIVEDLSDRDFALQCPRPITETDKNARLEAADKLIQADLSLHRLEQTEQALTRFQRAVIEYTCQVIFACSIALRLGGL